MNLVGRDIRPSIRPQIEATPHPSAPLFSRQINVLALHLPRRKSSLNMSQYGGHLLIIRSVVNGYEAAFPSLWEK